MVFKASLAGSLIVIAASLGQAAAGQTISEKNFSPNEVGPSAYRQAYAQQNLRARRSSVAQKAASPRSCTYQGGPKSTL